MDTNNRTRRTVSLPQRIVFVLLGIFAAFLFLEIGLRISALITISLQEQRNHSPLSARGEYRILCLGESTTAGQYPSFLEQALNQRGLGIRFKVIDKGVVATTSGNILLNLENNLNKYRPDMVIAMMGSNDKRVLYYKDIPERESWLFRHSKTFKFFCLLYGQITRKLKNRPLPDSDEAIMRMAEESELRKASTLEKLRWIASEETLKRAILLNPDNDLVYLEMGEWLRDRKGQWRQAEESFQKAISLNPRNSDAYAELGWLYLTPDEQGRYHSSHDEVEALFKKAIALEPGFIRAYCGLVRLYFDQGEFGKAEAAVKDLSSNPEDMVKDWAYRILEVLYRATNQEALAQECRMKRDALGLEDCSVITAANYRLLNDTLAKRRVRLVCMQYPMRQVASLKAIFKDDPDVVFVDNDRVFKEAIRRKGYNYYFVDSFGGDFGHCTEEGNRLLAKNIAQTLVREVFSKDP